MSWEPQSRPRGGKNVFKSARDWDLRKQNQCPASHAEQVQDNLCWLLQSPAVCFL